MSRLGTKDRGDGEAWLVEPARGPLRGVVRLPGSKSLTHRALALAAIAEGMSVIDGALDAEDPRRFIAALELLGVEVRREGPPGSPASRLAVLGTSGRLDGGATLDLGESGTGARVMMALATLASGPVRIDGAEGLRRRPMQDGIAILRSLSATIRESGDAGRLPLEVSGGGLRGGRIAVGETASSQFLSACLLVAPATSQGVELILTSPPTSGPYLWMTLRVLREAGLSVELDRDLPREGSPADGPTRIHVPRQPINARAWSIEPDASSAVFLAAAAAIVPGSSILIERLQRSGGQPDAAAIDALAGMGATIEWTTRGVRIDAPAELRGITLDASGCPDAVPALAAVAACASTPSRLVGLATLRVKESDRIEAIAEGMRACGVGVEVGPDWLTITPRSMLPTPAMVDPRADHRIAMAFAVLGLRREGLAVLDPACVGKSDPGFWDRLDAVRTGRRCEEFSPESRP